MDVGHFTGQVLRAAYRLTLNSAHRIRLPQSDLGPPATFTIAVVEAVLDIECEVDAYSDDILGFLNARAFDLARACIDVVAFGSGQGLTITLDTFTRPDGTTTPIAFAIPHLVNECTVFRTNPTTPQDNADFHAPALQGLSAPP